jgi:hypothetical protein
MITVLIFFIVLSTFDSGSIVQSLVVCCVAAVSMLSSAFFSLLAWGTVFCSSNLRLGLPFHPLSGD